MPVRGGIGNEPKVGWASGQPCHAPPDPQSFDRRLCSNACGVYTCPYWGSAGPVHNRFEERHRCAAHHCISDAVANFFSPRPDCLVQVEAHQGHRQDHHADTCGAKPATHHRRPPASTAQPAATAQPCPYLRDSIVLYTTGQHLGPTQVIATKPYPVCMFYRSDGGWLATVRIIKASTPAAAVAAVNQHVAIAGSEPANKPAGWIGGSFSKGKKVANSPDGLSVYAVCKGNFAIVVQETEPISIKARTIAICALIGSKLDSELSPDFCSGQPES